MIKVLIVDDSALIRGLLKEVLEQAKIFRLLVLQKILIRHEILLNG